MSYFKRLVLAGFAAGIIAIAALSIVVGYGTGEVRAQPYSTLSDLSVAGVAIGPAQAVTIGDPRPVIQGSATAGTTVSIRITPGNVTLSATTGSDGKFRVQIPSALAPGGYTIFVNDQAAGTFTVTAAPEPPATGTGFLDDSRSRVQFALLAAAALFVAGAVAARARVRMHRR